VDVNHVSEFVDGGMLAHQHRYFLHDVGGMGAIGVTAEDESRGLMR
jgi:hypothetical protein